MLQPPHAALTHLLALSAGWVIRHQHRVIKYLLDADCVRLTDGERRRLSRLGMAVSCRAA